MDDCVFCKIVKGEIPCHKIYEDDNFLAFLDINPINFGHTLLIPKVHYRWIYDVPNFGQYWQIAQKIALAIKKSPINPEYISFLTMGNEVFHAHIHLIPRFTGDAVQPILHTIPHVKPNETQLVEIAQNIKNLIQK